APRTDPRPAGPRGPRGPAGPSRTSARHIHPFHGPISTRSGHVNRRIMLAIGLLTTVLAGSTAGTATATTPAPGRDIQAVDATVITEVTPVGYKVIALAIEYDGIVRLGRTGIDESAFDVQVTLTRPGAAPRTGTRTVVDAYTNNAPGLAERQR